MIEPFCEIRCQFHSELVSTGVWLKCLFSACRGIKLCWNCPSSGIQPYHVTVRRTNSTNVLFHHGKKMSKVRKWPSTGFLYWSFGPSGGTLRLLFNVFSSHSFMSYYPRADGGCLVLLLYPISANRVSVCRSGQEPRLSAAPLGCRPVSADTVWDN